jgi:glycerol-3-phosphate dehydrogenase
VVTTGQISRDHSAQIIPPGNGVDFPIYSLVGGKWTTFRAFAEQVTDELLACLKHPRRTSSANLAIGGGQAYPAERAPWITNLAQQSGLPPERIAALLERYGTRAAEVAAFINAGSDEPLSHHPGYSRREIQFMVEREYALHIDDVILRRTLLAILGQLSFELIAELGAIMAASLGWSPEQSQQEIAQTLHLLETRCGVQLSPSPARH